MKTLIFFALSISAGTIGAIGDALLNQWAKHGGSWWWIVGGFVGWNIALVIFLYMLKKQYLLAYSAGFFAAANSVAIMILCWLVFHEELSRVSWLGIGLVFIGLVIAELGR